MAHNTSGLPPLDIEPFDPSPLYAAASSPERRVPVRRGPSRLVRVGGVVLGLLLLVAVAAATALL